MKKVNPVRNTSSARPGRIKISNGINWRNEKTEALCRALLSLKTETEVAHFLRDLLTEPELLGFGNRLRAAEMLGDGVPYSQIETETGLSSTTVARVAKWLKGSEGGYRTVLKRQGE